MSSPTLDAESSKVGNATCDDGPARIVVQGRVPSSDLVVEDVGNDEQSRTRFSETR